jgi:hypothetical protein
MLQPLPAAWESVTVRLDGGDHIDATLQVAAQLAAARAVKLYVDASGRTARRINAVLEELTKHGLGIRWGAGAPHPSLVVANDGGRVNGAHASVRRNRMPSPPRRPSGCRFCRAHRPTRPHSGEAAGFSRWKRLSNTVARSSTS